MTTKGQERLALGDSLVGTAGLCDPTLLGWARCMHWGRPREKERCGKGQRSWQSYVIW